jgi:hypothetical protein
MRHAQRPLAQHGGNPSVIVRLDQQHAVVMAQEADLASKSSGSCTAAPAAAARRRCR